MKHRRALIWILPWAVYAADAYAWGLYTHLYFAQLLLWAVPLTDARFRRALRRFPELCLAGTCLPDVSLFSKVTASVSLRTTHQWSAAARMLNVASTDQERAIALGYAGHLLTDIVAHNYFVPAHETRWLGAPMLSHAACEWAMDAHVANQLYIDPQLLIARHGGMLASCAEVNLGCDGAAVRKALYYMQHGEQVLRRSRLPGFLYRVRLGLDANVAARFDRYISETSGRLHQINRLVSGETPAWLPEVTPASHVRQHPQHPPAGRYSLLLPADFFHDLNHNDPASTRH